MLLPIRVQSLHPDTLVSRACAVIKTTLRHSPPTRLASLKEFSQALFTDIKRLRGRSIRHARHGSPEIEGVSNVSADGGEDEEDEVYWIAKNWEVLVEK